MKMTKSIVGVIVVMHLMGGGVNAESCSTAKKSQQPSCENCQKYYEENKYLETVRRNCMSEVMQWMKFCEELLKALESKEHSYLRDYADLLTKYAALAAKVAK